MRLKPGLFFLLALHGLKAVAIIRRNTTEGETLGKRNGNIKHFPVREG